MAPRFQMHRLAPGIQIVANAGTISLVRSVTTAGVEWRVHQSLWRRGTIGEAQVAREEAWLQEHGLYDAIAPYTVLYDALRHAWEHDPLSSAPEVLEVTLIPVGNGYHDDLGQFSVMPREPSFGRWEVAPILETTPNGHETKPEPDHYDHFFWSDTLYQARLHIQRCRGTSC
jgi:hypothetical protein